MIKPHPELGRQEFESPPLFLSSFHLIQQRLQSAVMVVEVKFL